LYQYKKNIIALAADFKQGRRTSNSLQTTTLQSPQE